ncbi:T9SS type A sorting domain-containing protein [Rufibacter immobilis]|uniref:T9SS type A sorting domain-containing protein n=1 Tax=Rufibacter immobilis TaxID=1348778 RepID=UPI0035E99C3D
MKKDVLSWAGTLMLILFCFSNTAFAAKCGETVTTVKAGNFSDKSIWSNNKVPSSCEKIVINHAVNINQEVWIGKNGQGELLINASGSLKGSGKLLVLNNKSLVTVNGALELNNFDFGINANDSAYFVNNGTVKIQGNAFFKKGSVINNGNMDLTLGSPEAIERITLKNNKTLVFSNSVHLNTGATVYNKGYFEVKSTADDALNINTGYFYNCGEVKIAGRLNFPSGVSLEKPNLLLNYGTVTADRAYMNHKSTLKNWGRLYVKNNFESTQGIIINYACGYIEQSTSGKIFHNWNDKAELTNDGFIKIKGDFKNTHGTVKGSGTIHVYGKSTNTDQGVITGTLCFYDFTKSDPAKIVDELLNQATIASTVKVCASSTEPALCPLPGCDGNDNGGGNDCVQSAECFEFTYKGFVRHANGTVTLSFSVKVNCSHDLSNAAFELPSGVKAISATGPSGYENGTNNPFYSIKFNTGSGYKNGKTADFTYTVDAAAFDKMTSLRVQAKASTTVGTVTFNPKGCGDTPGEDDGGDDDGGDCVAVDECFKFIYKGYVTLPNGNVKLIYEVITNCNHALSNVAFQLPAGAKALNPTATTYKYKVENTTNNPFYSVKFEATNAEGYKNGKSDTFSYELTAAEFAKLTTIMVQAKAAGIIGKVTFNAKGCNPAPCEKPNVTLAGPDTICNLSDEAYTFRVSNPQAGVTYSFQVPEGLAIEEQGADFITVRAFLEEDQLGQPQTITVTATNACGTATANISFVVADCGPGNPLPVEMTRFEGVSRNGAVELAWSTATEINNDRFEVERSTDGTNFKKIGEVKGAGNSNVALDYTFTDRQAGSGALYYRLRQVDTDNAFEYSKIIAVRHTAGANTAGIRLFPNPVATKKVTIQFDQAPQSDVSVRLTDLSGRVLHTAALGSDGIFSMESLSLRQGIYLISIISDGKTETQRLVVQ